MRAELPGTGPDERTRFIDGLRVLASTLEAHPEVPLPYHGASTEITFYFLTSENPRADLAAAARAIPCSWKKQVTEDGKFSPGTMQLTGSIGALKVQLSAYRDDVCRRVVTGTEDREVEVVVKPAVTEKVVRPVETYRWDCSPVLARALADDEPAELAS